MLRKPESNIEIRYLDQGLHRCPQKMPSLVQDQIEQVAARAGEIVLGYDKLPPGPAKLFWDMDYAQTASPV
jgi:hypothetical protein